MNLNSRALGSRIFRLLLWSWLQLSLPILAARPDDDQIATATHDAVVLPQPVGDPIEPLNRGLWAVNKGLMLGVIEPSSKAYRVIVPRPLRERIRDAGRNLTYPKRLVNHLLQERWTGARDETYRFFCNSVFGIGGLFDVGTRWGIPASDADFGQTFGHWGWRPHFFLMLPIAGPSNERDALGSVLDGMLNPLTYFPPYSYITYGITYNNLTDSVDEYARLTKIDFDPYFVLKYAWTIKRESRGVELTFEGPQHAASLETLQAVFFTPRNPKFPEYADTLHVQIPRTGRSLPVSVWLQRRAAPIVYIVPGLGSHRWGGGTMALAEVLFNDGFSVATVSSTFNHEFTELASTVAMPGYTPVDSRDLHSALSQSDALLRVKYRNRITARALMGYSMGGFHALRLAATEHTNDTGVKFDRYVAIDAPVDLNFAIQTLDDYFRAAFEWPAGERTQRIENTFLKVAALSDRLHTLTNNAVIPFNASESKFLIGLAFRLTLRDVIFLSQSRTNQGVLEHPIDYWRREPVYREILQFSFAEYLEKFVVPYYRGLGIDADEIRNSVDLRPFAGALRQNQKIRVIENENDILLGEQGLAWLRATIPAEHLTVFPRGGHLGNLNHPAVQQKILETVADLKTPGPR